MPTQTPFFNDFSAYLKLIRLALPIILANASVPLLGLVDTAVIGQMGQTADLAAIALAGLIFSFVYWAFSFLRMGTTGFVSQAVGADNRNELHAVVFRTLILGSVIGLALIILQQPIQRIAGYFLSASPEVNSLVKDYFVVRIWGAPATLITFALMGIFIGLGWTKQILVIQLLLNGLNMLLNVIFVVFLTMGVKGIALGTLIAEWVTLIYGLTLVIKKLELRPLLAHFQAHAAQIFDKQKIKALFLVNGDIMIRTLALLAGFAWFARQGAGLGDAILAANHILLQFISMAAYFLDAFANVTEMIAGQAYGAKKRPAFVRAVIDNSVVAALSAFFLALSLMLFGHLFIQALTPDAELQGIANQHKIYAALYTFISFAAYQLDGIFIGVTNSKAMRNSTVIAFINMVSVGYLLTGPLANIGLWLALIVFVFVRGVVLLLYYPKVLNGTKWL
ncbi:DNA damage-inducible protein F [Oligella sp. MSHR50489EDL]|uniref:MATE family efflux transporter n=1 Tax=Oligella sp. MSHR50489EDL TaxID=3139409 RepID=UPI003D8146BA